MGVQFSKVKNSRRIKKSVISGRVPFFVGIIFSKCR